MTFRGATLRLNGGSFVIHTDAIAFPQEFAYGLNEDFLKVFVQSYVKLLCDSPLEKLSKRPHRSYMAFLKRLCNERLGTTIKLFSGYADELLRSEYSSGSDSSTRVFHEFMRDTPVFKEYHHWVMTGNLECLSFVISFLLFGKKLEYDDPAFDATAFRGWREVEDKLSTLRFSAADLANLRCIVRTILPPLEMPNLYPKFGSGKVSERGIANVHDKLSSLAWTPRLAYAFRRLRPFMDESNGFGDDFSVIPTHSVSDFELARLKFVPKDITKSRSICMEPNTVMYFQQEVLRHMVSAMNRGLISRFVDLADQSRNQKAALHGSQFLSSDTIDLSSASDSVHKDLVRGIFPPSYLVPLFATRTSSVIVPDGGEVSIHKFAPMGSAVCFPVQCIVFTACSIYASIAVHLGQTTESLTLSDEIVLSFLNNRFHKSRDGQTPFTQGIYEPPVVYGDDIIIDCRVTDEVISTLVRLGFSVNRSKSFTGSQSFRESCGVFCYEGSDVTPAIFRLPFLKKGKWDASVYSSIIGAINKFGQAGFIQLRSYLLSLLREYGFKYALPFTESTEDFGIFTRHKHRVRDEDLVYVVDWQQYGEIQQGIGSRKDPPVKEGSDLYYSLELYRKNQWWRSRVSGYAAPSFGRGLLIRPQETRLAPTWARCEL